MHGWPLSCYLSPAAGASHSNGSFVLEGEIRAPVATDRRCGGSSKETYPALFADGLRTNTATAAPSSCDAYSA
jgi:hypothetical protein